MAAAGGRVDGPVLSPAPDGATTRCVETSVVTCSISLVTLFYFHNFQ